MDGSPSAELSLHAPVDDAGQLALASTACQHPDGLAGVEASGVAEHTCLAPTLDSRVQVMIDQVDGDTLSHYVGDLSGEWPVIVDGDWVTLSTRWTRRGCLLPEGLSHWHFHFLLVDRIG